jgi:hypothetical protein
VKSSVTPSKDSSVERGKKLDGAGDGAVCLARTRPWVPSQNHKKINSFTTEKHDKHLSQMTKVISSGESCY